MTSLKQSFQKSLGFGLLAFTTAILISGCGADGELDRQPFQAIDFRAIEWVKPLKKTPPVDDVAIDGSFEFKVEGVQRCHLNEIGGSLYVYKRGEDAQESGILLTAAYPVRLSNDSCKYVLYPKKALTKNTHYVVGFYGQPDAVSGEQQIVEDSNEFITGEKTESKLTLTETFGFSGKQFYTSTISTFNLVDENGNFDLSADDAETLLEDIAKLAGGAINTFVTGFGAISLTNDPNANNNPTRWATFVFNTSLKQASVTHGSIGVYKIRENQSGSGIFEAVGSSEVIFNPNEPDQAQLKWPLVSQLFDEEDQNKTELPVVILVSQELTGKTSGARLKHTYMTFTILKKP